MQLTLTMEAEAVLRMLKELPHEMLPLATSRALNKTAASAKSTAVKALAKNIGLAQNKLRPCVQLRQATPRCCDALLFVAKGKRLPLITIDPKAKQGRAGVSYRGGAGLKRSIAHAFIATMPSGHRGVYARKPSAGRLPIHELLGPSIDYVFKQPVIQTEIYHTVQARWQSCCEQELRFLLQKKRLS
jgi:hypothetical protein